MKEIETPECRFDYRWNNLCWFQPAPFTPDMKIAHIDRKTLVDFGIHPEKLQEFIASLVAQEEAVTARFLMKLGV